MGKSGKELRGENPYGKKGGESRERGGKGIRRKKRRKSRFRLDRPEGLTFEGGEL